MRILSRYLLASYLGFYVAILIVAILVVAIVELMLNLDAILENREGLWGIASHLFLRLPGYYLPYLIPAASFGASFLCLGLPARAHEILAIKAGGIAPQRAAAPVLVAAVALSVLALALNETLVRDAASAYQRLGEGDRGEGPFQARGSFWLHRGSFLYNVREADRASRTLYGVRIYERDPSGRLLRRIEARSARIAEDDRWHLREGTIRAFDPDDPTAAPDTQRIEEIAIDVGSERDLALLDADASSLSILGLREYIDALDRDGRNPARYRALLHERLAAPGAVVLFTLLGVPLGLAVERSRSIAVAGVQGIGILGLFYAVQTTTSMIATSGAAFAVPAPWLVLAAFGGYGAWRLARVPS